jgi:hypothetical protein
MENALDIRKSSFHDYPFSFFRSHNSIDMPDRPLYPRLPYKDKAMTLDFFSLPQVLGYATFLVSMVAFAQKRDRHLKVWLIGQNLLYAAHFFLMDNPAAMAGALISATRNSLSLRTRALWVALLLLSANVLLGFVVVKTVWNLLPLVATAIATLSIFRLQGMRLRLGLFCTTLLWLANNILTCSIGGTAIELVIAIISCITIFRLYRGSLKRGMISPSLHDCWDYPKKAAP